jgi:phage tail sheath gpL-like
MDGSEVPIINDGVMYGAFFQHSAGKQETSMKKIKSAHLLIGMSLLFAGCKPDLLVTTLETTGPATINAQNSVEVPVRVVVRNRGGEPAGVFKVSTEYTGGAINPSTTFAVAFTVPGQANIWYPYTNEPLAAGNSASFEGHVTFHPSEHGVAVSLKARADSCSGDEFMPVYCRVEESNESNNESAALSVPLP